MTSKSKFENFKELLIQQLGKENPTIVLDTEGETREYTGQEAVWFLHGAATALLLVNGSTEVEVSDKQAVFSNPLTH